MIKKVLFVGSKILGWRVCSQVYKISPDRICGVVTLDDSADHRSAFSDFHSFSSTTGIPLVVASSRQDLANAVKKFSPDLVLVVGWYWMIAKDTLTTPPFGFIGIHNSLLPKFRGFSPLVWSIIAGESEVGFSLFSLSEGLDDGKIWYQGKLDIAPTEYIGEILNRLEMEVLGCFRNYWMSILNGAIHPIAQTNQAVSFCAQRLPEDGILNWRLPANQIINLIRAQARPYPGAFFILGEKKIVIQKASLIMEPYFGSPGQVAQISDESVIVICGDNRAVAIEQVERDGCVAALREVFHSIRMRL